MGGSLVGPLGIAYTADTSSFEAGTERVRAGMQSVEEQGNRSGSSLLGAFTRPFSALLNFGSQLGMTVFGLQNIAQTALSFGAALLGPAANLEQLTVGFTTLLHSGQKAQQFLSDLKAFADKSPFTFTELTGASQRMLAFGFSAQQTESLIRSVSNAVAAMGGNVDTINQVTLALGQMQAHGKVDAQDMLQLTSAGIPAWDMLAKAMGLSVAQVQALAERGAIPASKAIQLLQQQMDKAFGGAAQAQSQTFAGLWSTVKDKFQTFLMVAGGPLLKALEGGLSRVVDIISSPAFKAFTDQVGAKITNLLGQAGGLLQSTVVPAFRSLMKAVADGHFIQFGESLLPKIGTIFQTIAGTVLPVVNNAFKTLLSILGSPGFQGFVSEVISQLQPALQKVGSIIQQVAIPVFNALKTLFTSNAWRDFASIVGTLLNGALSVLGGIVGNVVVPVLGFLVGVLGKVLDALDTYYKFLMRVIPTLQSIGQAIGGFFANAWNTITTFFSQAGATISSGIQHFIGFFVALGQGIWNTVTGAFNAIKATIQNAINFIAGLFVWLYQHNYYFQALVDAIVGAFNWIKSTATAIWNNIANFLNGTWNKIKAAASAAWLLVKSYIVNPIQNAWNTVSGIAGNIIARLRGAWNTVVGDVKSAWDRFTGAIKGAVGNVAGAIKSIVDTITNKIKDLISQAFQWGQNLIKQFTNGIKNMAGSAWDAVKDFASGVADFLGFHSPPKAGPLSDSDTYAPNFVHMLADGLTRNKQLLESAAKGLASSLQMTVSPALTTTGMSGDTTAPPVVNNNAATSGGGYKQATIIIELDGRQVARVVGVQLEEVIRAKLGIR